MANTNVKVLTSEAKVAKATANVDLKDDTVAIRTARGVNWAQNVQFTKGDLTCHLLKLHYEGNAKDRSDAGVDKMRAAIDKELTWAFDCGDKANGAVAGLVAYMEVWAGRRIDEKTKKNKK